MAALVGYLLLFLAVGIGFIFIHLLAGKRQALGSAFVGLPTPTRIGVAIENGNQRFQSR